MDASSNISVSMPRHVSLALCLQALFDRYYTIFGWGFFGAGLIFLLILPDQLASTAGFEPMSLWFLLIPIIGLALIITGIRQGFRAIRLMRSGLPAMATLVSVECTNSFTRQGGSIYRLRFQFTAMDGQQYSAVYATNKMKPAWRKFYNLSQGQSVNLKTAESEEKLVSSFQAVMPSSMKSMLSRDIAELHEAEAPDPKQLQEMILYVPANPVIAGVPGDLIQGVCLDEQNNIVGENETLSTKVTVVPLLVTLAYVGTFIYLINHFCAHH